MTDYLKSKPLKDYELLSSSHQTQMTHAASLVQAVKETSDSILRAGQAYTKSRAKTVVKRYSIK